MQLINRSNDEWNLIGIQEALLKILYDIDVFCQKYEIEYFLVDGSALGAVRHSGFIPWDDDIDIGMTKTNYEKFRRLYWASADKNTYYLQEFGFCNGMITRAKIRKNGTYIKENIDKYKKRDTHMGLSVDIFVFHNAPDSLFWQRWQHLWGRYLRYKRPFNAGFLKNNKGGIFFRILAGMPKMLLVKYALSQQYRWDNSETKFLSSFYAEKGFKHALYKKEWFDKIIRIHFETLELPVCKGVQDYLKCMYGDYNKIPNKDQILKDQHVVEYSETTDFRSLFSHIDCYKDDRWNL